MNLEHRSEGDVLVVTIPEERLDYVNVNSFKNAMLDIIGKGHRKIAIDLSKVTFMDSRGLSAFLSLIRALGQNGAMALCHLSAPIRRVFAVTRTDRVVRIFPNMVEALAFLND